MTTIAYKDGVLCTDSQVSNDIVKASTTQKIFTSKRQDIIIAACGSYIEQQKIKQFVDKRHTSTEELLTFSPSLSGESEVYVFVKDLSYLPKMLVSNDFIDVPMTEGCFSSGTGSNLALGAMLAGASSYEALEICCKYDNFSCEPVQSLHIPKV